MPIPERFLDELIARTDIVDLVGEYVRLTKKGRIEVGADGDLCLFSPENIRENGTFQDPRQLASGMDYVFVGGVPAIAEGKCTGARNGTIL